MCGQELRSLCPAVMTSHQVGWIHFALLLILYLTGLYVTDLDKLFHYCGVGGKLLTVTLFLMFCINLKSIIIY